MYLLLDSIKKYVSLLTKLSSEPIDPKKDTHTQQNHAEIYSQGHLLILVQGCTRLIKLELCGCEGSFDEIKA